MYAQFWLTQTANKHVKIIVNHKISNASTLKIIKEIAELLFGHSLLMDHKGMNSLLLTLTNTDIERIPQPQLPQLLQPLQLHPPLFKYIIQLIIKAM